MKRLQLRSNLRLLGSLLEQSEFELIHFENRPSKDGSGVPDVIIHSSTRLLLETKTVRNAVDDVFLSTGQYNENRVDNRA